MYRTIPILLFSYRKVARLIIFFLIVILQSPLPAQDWIAQVIVYTINTDFDSAVALCQSEISAQPDDFRAQFYLAATLNSRMIHFENQDGFDQFEQAISRTIELVQERLQTDKNPAPQSLAEYFFYLGSAYGFRAYNQGRNGKWLAAFSNGLKANNYLQDAVREDPKLYDAYLGIGTYKYWRTSKLSFIYWLPFLSDEREEGIDLIRKAAESDCPSRDLARHQLVYILLDYGRNNQAIAYARQLVETYPHSQFMCWALAHAYYKSQDYTAAEQSYLCLARLIENDPHKNINHLLNCRYKLATVYMELHQYSSCVEQCNSLINLYDAYAEKFKFDKIDQVYKLERQARKKLEMSAVK